MSSPRRAVIFDFDGTLIDAYQAVEESVNYTLGRLGYRPVSGAMIKRRVGWGDRHLIRQLVKEKDYPRAVRIYRRHHPAALRRGTTLLPGAKRILTELRQRKYLMAVATNRARRFTELIARELKISKYFDCMVCGDEIRRPKPYPDMLNRILLKLKISPKDAVFIGDMVLDVQAGKRAGILTVGVTTGSSTRRELVKARPQRVIRHLEEFKPLLARWSDC